MLHLDDVETVTCAECGEDYTLDDVREMIEDWQRVLTWIELAPPLA